MFWNKMLRQIQNQFWVAIVCSIIFLHFLFVFIHMQLIFSGRYWRIHNSFMEFSQNSVKNVTSAKNNELINRIFRKHNRKKKENKEKVGYPPPPFFFLPLCVVTRDTYFSRVTFNRKKNIVQLCQQSFFIILLIPWLCLYTHGLAFSLWNKLSLVSKGEKERSNTACEGAERV